MKEAACPLFRPEECAGTPDCPPRCPRYVTDEGRTYTVYDAAEADVDAGALESLFADAPVTADAVRDAETLVALRDGLAGAAVRDGDRTVVRLPADGDPAVATELCRQAVARAVAAGDGNSLAQDAPPAALDRLAAELGARRAPGRLVVDLEGRAARQTATMPAEVADVAPTEDLNPLFDPDTVAVVGATDREGAIGRVVTENLLADFEGTVVPVTDRHDEVLTRIAPDSLSAVERDVDLAVVVLPADAALSAVRAAGESDVDAVAVLSAGFGETDDEGRQREARLRSLAAAHDLRLVGPNSLGVLSARGGLNASFAPDPPAEGAVSMCSHSGAFVTATLEWAAEVGLGFRDVVSLGNAAGVDEAALLRWWGRDPGTDAVLAYLEDVADGDRFVRAAREVTPTTPVFALKAGASEAGARAAASHTGALTGDDEGFDAAFDASGVVRVDSQAALYDAALAAERLPLPRGDRVAVVSNAGGPGVLAADAVAATDLELASLTDETRARLESRLPAAASADVPIDVLGDAPVERFADALDVVLADPGVDAAVVVSTPHPLIDRSELARAVGEAAERHGVPIATCLSGALDDAATDALTAAGVPNYPDATRAADALAALRTYARWRRRSRTTASYPPVDDARVRDALAEAAATDRTTLGPAALSVVDAAGVDTPAGGFAASPETAGEIAGGIGGAVALKVASPDLEHKSDAGGVRVGLAPEAVPSTTRDLLETVAAAAPEATVDGVVVQELAEEGVECVVGVTQHPRFGPVVTFGLGGVLVEHLEDVAHGLAPLSTADARRLIRSIDGASVLEGARGEDPVDLDALADAIARLSWVAAEFDAVETLEVNPLVATPDGAVAVDLHCELEPDAPVADAGEVDAGNPVGRR